MRKSFLTFLATILFCAPSFATDYPIGDNNNSQTSPQPLSPIFTTVSLSLTYNICAESTPFDYGGQSPIDADPV